MEAAVAAALAQSTPFDDALGAPHGAVAALATAAAALVSLLVCSSACSRGGGKGKKSARAIRNTVLFAGPSGSGKTTMMHQVRRACTRPPHPTHSVCSRRSRALPACAPSRAPSQLAFGKAVATVPGMKQNVVRTRLVDAAVDAAGGGGGGGGGVSGPVVTLVDFPGIAQLRK
jgi:hypothetical protein